MSAKINVKGELKFLLFTLTHPFDGFYELRFRRKRAWWLICALYALCGLVSLASVYYSGFLINGGRVVYGVNNWFVFVSALFPYFLFALSNWSVTTLFDGNGSFSDILMVLAYSLAPKLVLDAAYIFVSNFVVSEEMALLNAFYIMGMLAFAFLAFAGLCVAHEYSAAKNVVTILATVAAAVVIMFIGMLYLQLMGKIIGFVNTVFTEFMKRGIRT